MHLKDTDCLPTTGGAWAKPDQVRYGSPAFQKLVPAETARALLGFDYLDRRVTADEGLLRQLGSRPIAPADWVSLFALHGAWLQQQPVEWRAQLLAAVAGLDHQGLVTAGLAVTPCVPVEGGVLAAPRPGAVFFPLSRGRKYGFEAELSIVDGELLAMATKLEPRVHDLLLALGVQRDDPYQVVQTHILPRHRGEGWHQSTDKAIVGHVRYVKDKLPQYLEAAAAAGRAPAAMTDLRTLRLATKSRGESWIFGHANTLYLAKEYHPPFSIESLLGAAVNLEMLVSADYLASKPADPQSEARSWAEFFVTLGMRTTPSVQKDSDGDVLCSPELLQLLRSSDSTVRKAALEWLDQNWAQYTAHLRYYSKAGRSGAWKDTSFAGELAAMQAPVRRGKSPIRIGQTFYPTPEIKDLFGDKLIYVDATLTSPGLLDACAITHRLDAGACIKRLQQLKFEGGEKTAQVQAIYRKLEALWSKEATTIKQAFALEPLIRVKGGTSAWYRPTDVVWGATGSAFLDGLYPALQPQYRDFHVFFHDKLGVRDLPTEKRVRALVRLGEIEDPATRKGEALAIYARANRDLGARFGKELSSLPDWVSVFEHEAVFLDHRGQLVAKNTSLYANDDPVLGALFADENVSLLAVPWEELPRVARLLDTAHVPRLSETVDVTLAEAKDPRELTELTKRARRTVAYLARLMFAKQLGRFEDAYKAGKLQALTAVRVYEVVELVRRATLGDLEKLAPADAAFSEGDIFVRAGARSQSLLVATQLCTAAGASDALVDAVYAILLTGSEEEADDYLLARNVAALPPTAYALPSDRLELEGHQSTGPTAPVAQDSTPTQAGPAPPASSSPRITVSTGGAAAGTGSVPAGAAGSDLPPAPAPRTTSMPDPAAALLKLAAAGARGSGESAGQDVDQPLAGEGPGVGVEPPQHPPVSPRRSRLLSYAEPVVGMAPPPPNESGGDQQQTTRDATGRAAVAHVMANRPTRWASFLEMPHFNPGFDIRAMLQDGGEELIEVKGLTGPWSAEGVALTPRELLTAQEHGDRYWLVVVEFAHDDMRRTLHWVQNPFGRTDQFRFDYGWQGTAVDLTPSISREPPECPGSLIEPAT